MNRRGFLHKAMLAAAALAIDPEALLWTPTKKIFIPAPQETRQFIEIDGQRYYLTPQGEDFIRNCKDYRIGEPIWIQHSVALAI